MTRSSYTVEVKSAADARRAIRAEWIRMRAWQALHLALRTFGVALILTELLVLVAIAEGTMDRMVGLAISLGACGTFNGTLPLIETAHEAAIFHRCAINGLQIVQGHRGWRA